MDSDSPLLTALRHDAVRVGRDVARSDAEIAEIAEDLDDIFFLAGFTQGEEKAWKKCIAAGRGPERRSIMQGLLSRQPALRLSLILEELAEIWLMAGHADLRTREGAIIALEWVESGCPPTLLPPKTVLDEIFSRLQTINRFKFPAVFLPKSPPPDKFGPQLRALRRRRFGWVVPPESGGENHMNPNKEGKMEYSRVWLSEAELKKYRANVPWSEIFA